MLLYYIYIHILKYHYPEMYVQEWKQMLRSIYRKLTQMFPEILLNSGHSIKPYSQWRYKVSHRLFALNKLADIIKET